MKVLHLLATGSVGGIEVLCRDIYRKSTNMENIFCFVFSGGEIAEDMRDNGADVRVLNYKNKDILKLINYLYNLCKDEHVDVAVVHHGAPINHIALAVLKSRLKSLKTVIYSHGNIQDTLRENIKRGLYFRKFAYSICFKRCDAVVAISESVKNSLIQRYGEQFGEKINIVYNGIDLDKFKPNCDIGMQNRQGSVNIIYVGRLFKAKGVDILVKSLAEISSEKNFICNIIGDGPEKENIKSLIKEYKLEDKVVLRGVQKNVPEWLNKSDIFVHPATWEEGFGITIAEAMAFGLICIAFNKGALPEIIDSGNNGFLIESVSEKSLSEKISYCIEHINDEELIEIRKRACESSQRFSIDKTVLDLEHIFNRLCSR
ncbi:glycosyltransferase [Intestinibacter sp.]|uniref:glycosyltransferase n=1 Tax=Intestinibacter sp. TaxID=1965304 RepID=UPI002A766B63|nr:glycosyltransferase [Intestinibacter sp.]MDY2735100.1 glycosyltransferase [Intestinibacter sp.]